MPPLREILGTIPPIVRFLGAGTFLTWLGWLYKKQREKFEDRILKMYEDGDWHGADGILGDIYLYSVLKGLPVTFVFPIATGWQGVSENIKALPLRMRHFIQKLWFMPSRTRVESTLLTLWKKGLLERAAFNPKYYRLKH